MNQTKNILMTTVYKQSQKDFYDWFNANTRAKFTFTVRRILSFGLRFIKQNVPGIEILENPTWEQYKAKINERKWDIVGFSFYLNEIHETLEMVEYARKAGVKELWAGNYGALTDGMEKHFDKVFVGYAEEQIARELGYEMKELIHPPLIQWLGYTIGMKLQTYGVLFTNRGCGVGCDFCQTPAFCPRPHRVPLKAIERVLRYYKAQNINEIVILDENFGIIRSHGNDVVKLLGDMDFYWYAMTKTNQLQRNLDYWIDNGFGGALIGIETLNQKTLDSIGKKQNVQDCIDMVSELHRLNRMIIGYYMIGFENDTFASIVRDIKEVAKLKLDVTQVCVLTPLPRTKQWYYIEENYGIFDRNWHHYNAKHLVWNHPHVSPKDMRRLLEWSFRRCYPAARTFNMTFKFHNRYRELADEGLLGGLKYMWRSQAKAHRFDYFPDEMPLFPVE